MVAAGGRVFAYGREFRRLPTMLQASPYAAYKLALDGSNCYHKVAELQDKDDTAGNFWRPQRMFVNPAGPKLGYLKNTGNTTLLFIHDVASGRLLHRVDLSKVFLDCFALTMGWTSDGSRLFFTLDTGDEDVTSKESYAHAGTYVIKEDGTNLARLPAVLVASQAEPGNRTPGTWNTMLAALPQDLYLFWEPESKPGARTSNTRLYLVSPATRQRRYYPIGPTVEATPFLFRVSDSGKSVAFLGLREAGLVPVWMLDLDSGKEQKLFSYVPQKLTRDPCYGVIGWLRAAP